MEETKDNINRKDLDKDETEDIRKKKEKDDEEIKDETIQVERRKDDRASTVIKTVKAAYLVCIDGKYFGKKFLLKSDETKIGREPNFNDIVLEGDTMASRRHAVIKVVGGKYVLQDKRSRNRTYINQKIVKEEDEVELKQGDEIEIGRNIFRFCYGDKISFAPPRKAGSLIKRILYILSPIVCIYIIIESLFFSMKEMNRYKIITQNPIGNFYEEALNIVNKNPILSVNNCNNSGGIDIPIVENGIISLYDIKEKKIIWEQNSYNIKSAYCCKLSENSKNYDILCQTEEGNIILLNGLDGSTVVSKIMTLLGPIVFPTIVVDIDKDNRNEIIATTENGYISIIKNIHSEFVISNKFNVGYPLNLPPVFAPKENIITFSGSKMFIVSLEGKISTFDLEEKYLQERMVKPSYSLDVISSPTIFIRNKELFVAAFCMYDQLFESDILGNVHFVKEVENIRKGGITKLGSPISVDLDNDGNDELIVPSYQENKILIYSSSKKSIINEFTLEGEPVSSPSIADVNKDKILDIIICDNLGYVYIINSNKASLIYKKKLFDSSVSTSTVIGDLYGNGFISILAKDNNGNMKIINTDAKIFKNEIIYGNSFGVFDLTNRFYYTSIDPKRIIKKIFIHFLLLILALILLLGDMIRRKIRIKNG